MPSCYRGVVGVVKPTRSAGSLEEMIRLLPEGVGVIPLFLNVREQVEGEFRAAFEQTEAKVRELATEFSVDLIHPEGAPLFMLQGWEAEQRILRGWEQEYGLPFFTSGSSCAEAMRALGIKRMVGLTYIKGEINHAFGRYFQDAGFEVLTMECVPGEFASAQQIPSGEVYRFAKQAVRRHPDADGMYLLGSGWSVLDVIEEIEQDLRIPVVHPCRHACGPSRSGCRSTSLSTASVACLRPCRSEQTLAARSSRSRVVPRESARSASSRPDWIPHGSFDDDRNSSARGVI